MARALGSAGKLNGERGAMDNFLARGLALAALLAGAGVFYHYVIYLPGVEREKKAAIAEKAAEVERQRLQRASQYKTCMLVAEATYSQNWAKACENVAADNARELENCLATPSVTGNPYLGRQWCKKQYGDIDASSECTLPGKRADGVNQYFTEAKLQCEKEAKLGI